MIDFNSFRRAIEGSRIAPWSEFLISAVEQKFQDYTHGDYDSWVTLINQLPEVQRESYDLTSGVTLTANNQLSATEKDTLKHELMKLHPWRKGPFNLFGIEIDTEWRSDWKWDRIRPHIEPLKNKSVLDIGCGNGYHCWRMLAEDPRFVLGIDPSQKYLAQFSVLQNYIQRDDCQFLPLGIEDMPDNMGDSGFDSVFCLGVLYHRRDPINLIYQIKNLLAPGGELILETLVVEGDKNTLLIPKGRYAQMRNVWFLPSSDMLELWLEKCGFSEVKTVNTNQTTRQEQRATDWMTFHSLTDYLNPKNSNQTIEGYPAPKRAILIAKK